jgi:hypothetical protein
MMSDWRSSKEEIEYYNQRSEEELKNIVKSGIDSEFWKWFRSRIALLIATAEASLLQGEVTTQDALLKVASMNAVYKQLYHLYNTPEYILAYKKPTLAPAPKSAKIGRT